MKILVFGAGVLGSLYAARLQDAGHEVTILARGERVEQIREHGLVLLDSASGVETFTRVEVVEKLMPEDAYDLAIILVRKNQLADVLPLLAANQGVKSFLFMVNNAAGPDALIQAVGRERVLMGFPGAGGTRRGYIVEYAQVSAQTQPTTIGELDGTRTARIEEVAAAFRGAGFPVSISSNIDAWLKTHVALVSPIANALYLADGDNYRLAKTRDGVVLMVRAIREGLKVLEASNIPITPAKYRYIRLVPEPILVSMMQKGFATQRAELVMARHANAARDEMGLLAAEFKQLAVQSGVPTPSMDLLASYIDPVTPSLSEGSASLSQNWRGLWAIVGGLALVNLSIGFLIARGKKSRCCSPSKDKTN